MAGNKEETEIRRKPKGQEGMIREGEDRSKAISGP